MKNLIIFGALCSVLLITMFGATLTGLHHVPTEQVYITESTPYSLAIRQAEKMKTCTTPSTERIEAGHCWFYPRNQKWYWCRPKIINRITEKFLTDDAVEQDFSQLIMESNLGIAGVQLVTAAEGRCVHYEGKDVYV